MGKKKRGCYVSDDMVIEIQLRLPIKSLLRFKCVCKTWQNRFQDPEFANTHHRKLQMLDDYDAEFSDSKLLLTRFASNPIAYNPRKPNAHHPCSLLRIIVDENERRNEIVVPKEYIILPFRNGTRFHFTSLGSCNGVICLELDSDDVSAYRIILWNFATREVRFLPPSNVRRFHNFGIPRSSIVGFGYDSKRNDFKVARELEYTLDNSSIPFFQLELYSLRDNSWKEISTKDAPNISITEPYNVITDGYYHQAYWEVISFDFINEVFIWTDLPNTPELEEDNFDRHSKIVTCFEKKLGLVIFPYENNFFDVWVLNEVGNGESWVKRLRIGCLNNVQSFVGIWKDKFMFVVMDDSLIGVYNVETTTFKRFMCDFRRYTPILLDYTGSIVSLDGVPEHKEGFVRVHL